MTAASKVFLLFWALSLHAAAVRAQMGELQAGVITSYGAGRVGGPTPGLVLGLAGGRLVYIGVRGTRYGETRVDASASTLVTDRATMLAVDLAVIIPVGHFEVMAGGSLGTIRRTQHAVQGATTTNGHSMRFVGAPSLSAEYHLGPVGLIPELQYQFSARPDLAYPVERVGWLASLRVVVLWEIARVRT